MKTIHLGILMLLVLSASITMAQTPTESIPVTVDCSNGQSLNRTLAKLKTIFPITVFVKGTCNEYVQVFGFNNLTLKGLSGAALAQPTTGTGNFLGAVLLIESSRSITVEGFNVQADPATGT